MASPWGGRSTGTPAEEYERVSHATPPTTETTWSTPRILPTAFPNPDGRPPGVQVRRVSGTIGVTGGGGVVPGAGDGSRSKGWPWATKPAAPPPTRPSARATATIAHLFTASPGAATSPPGPGSTGRTPETEAIGTCRRRPTPGCGAAATTWPGLPGGDPGPPPRPP